MSSIIDYGSTAFTIIFSTPFIIQIYDFSSETYKVICKSSGGHPMVNNYKKYYCYFCGLTIGWLIVAPVVCSTMGFVGGRVGKTIPGWLIDTIPRWLIETFDWLLQS